MQESALSTYQQAIYQARQILSQQPVYLDTETTGLDRSAEIVEISIVDHDGNILFESLVRPSQPIPLDATRIHHITESMVQDYPTWPAIWPKVRSLLFGRVLAIYNEEFDIRMMRQSHKCYGLPWKEQFNAFCIMTLYALYRGEWDYRRHAFRYYSLKNAGLQCNINLPNTHRATDDALLSRSILHYIANPE